MKVQLLVPAIGLALIALAIGYELNGTVNPTESAEPGHFMTMVCGNSAGVHVVKTASATDTSPTVQAGDLCSDALMLFHDAGYKIKYVGSSGAGGDDTGPAYTLIKDKDDDDDD